MINLEIVRRKNSLSNRKSPGAGRSSCNTQMMDYEGKLEIKTARRDHKQQTKRHVCWMIFLLDFTEHQQWVKVQTILN